MEEFPGNSRSKRLDQEKTTPAVEEEPRLDKVVTGKVVRRKKTLGRRIKETLFSGDSSSVFGYLLKEVLVPALQATATDMVTQGIEKAVYGEVRSANRTVRGVSSSTPRTHISYDRASSIVRPSSSATTRRPTVQPSAFNLGEYILAGRMEAEAVADGLTDTIKDYNCVTVANLKDLVGESSVYTDHKWGWTDLSGMAIKRVREGYLLQLPDPEDLR